ncbi:hypothetical protein AAEX28_05550 [Lentisphaerota bacterium WC36G]|nr:hypothetical protein LJT99_08410 [Lentisphaerae bacterium WC36]
MEIVGATAGMLFGMLIFYSIFTLKAIVYKKILTLKITLRELKAEIDILKSEVKGNS